MAYAISGCVIVGENGRFVSYKRRCNSCGYVEPGMTRAVAPNKYGQLKSSFVCPKCRKRSDVTVGG